jgi:hypothetical protein
MSTPRWRIMLAQIRYHYKIPNPEELFDDDYLIMLFQDLQYMRNEERKNQVNIF